MAGMGKSLNVWKVLVKIFLTKPKGFSSSLGFVQIIILSVFNSTTVAQYDVTVCPLLRISMSAETDHGP